MPPPFLRLPLFPLFPLLLLILVSCETVDNSDSVSFELIHRHHRDLSERIHQPATHLERLRELAHNDQLRHRWISMKLGRSPRRRANEVGRSKDFLRMSMTSAAYAHGGSYFVIFNIGTPSQKFLMVADTGSDLTWMNCRYKCQKCKPDRELINRRVFRADDSRTFKLINCSSSACMHLPRSRTTCPEPSAPCYYLYSYMKESKTYGFYANESATIHMASGKRKKVRNVIIGCSLAYVGSTFRVADGILSLGYGGHSFLDRALEQFNFKFSYCLVDHYSSRFAKGYLSFGATPPSNISMTYATLYANEVIRPYYYVDVMGISVDGVMLDIPPIVWDLRSMGGAILDCGSTLTYLPEQAYRPLMNALMEGLKGFERVKFAPFEFCFSTKKGFTDDMAPKMVWHWGESVRFEPPVKNYLIEVEDTETRCAGLMPLDWPNETLIGNIMQQGHHWEFDYMNGVLGFRPSPCVST